jgi:hypothetical protein
MPNSIKYFCVNDELSKRRVEKVVIGTFAANSHFVRTADPYAKRSESPQSTPYC